MLVWYHTIPSTQGDSLLCIIVILFTLYFVKPFLIINHVLMKEVCWRHALLVNWYGSLLTADTTALSTVLPASQLVTCVLS